MSVKLNECRDGCGAKIRPVITWWKHGIDCSKCGKLVSRTVEIRCGYCGEKVDQTNVTTMFGKWFHNECFRSYKSFHASMVDRPIRALDKRKDVRVFRDYILTQMIMRKDLRSLKYHWDLMIANKSVPIVAVKKRYAKLLIMNQQKS